MFIKIYFNAAWDIVLKLLILHELSTKSSKCDLEIEKLSSKLYIIEQIHRCKIFYLTKIP